MFFGFYCILTCITFFGLVFFIERNNKIIPRARLGLYSVIIILLSTTVLVFETILLNNNTEIQSKMNAKLIIPISTIEDTIRNQYVLLYFDDSVKTTTIPKDDVFVSPEKLKIYTYPLTIIQQR